MRTLRSVLLTAILLLVASCGQQGTFVSGGSAPGSKVDFKLAALDGGQLGTADFRGQVVLFDFWATWCSPCHVQAEILASIYGEFEARGVEFVAVSLGEPEATVRRFTKRRPFPYSVLVDPYDLVSTQLGIYVLPTIMVLNREGEIVYLQEGVSSARRLRSVLDEALGAAETASL